MSMDYPTRGVTHMTESESRKILASKAPKSWIIREITERDYGVDAYIEIASPDNKMTGELFLAQIKGTTAPIKWLDEFSGYRVKKTTLNYWMGLPVPVFLFLTDCKNNEIYFASVKLQVRTRYADYLSQKEFGFLFNEPMKLGTPEGDNLFNVFYQYEKLFPEIQSNILTMLLHWQDYLHFVESNCGLDPFLTVEHSDELRFIHIYQTCASLAIQQGIPWTLIGLADLYKQNMAEFESRELRNHTLEKVLPQLRLIILEIVRRLVKQISETEQDYWMAKHPAVLRECCHLSMNRASYPELFPK